MHRAVAPVDGTLYRPRVSAMEARTDAASDVGDAVVVVPELRMECVVRRRRSRRRRQRRGRDNVFILSFVRTGDGVGGC